MTYIMIRFNRTHTDEFYPIFEIFYAFELRLSLCNLVVQGLLGISARLICIYNLYVGNWPLENRTAIIVASFLRVSLFETFVSVIFFFALERLIATFAWSWYEKASLPTLTVFVAIEGCAVSWAWTWSIALLNEFIAVKKLLIGVICSLIIGCATLAVVIVVNLRASAQLKVGARINQYSVARSYQIHENIIIMKALVRIAIRVLMLNIPVIILSIISNFVSGEHALVKRMITRACFDLVISFYPPAIISYIPFSDAIFERSLKRTALGRRLFSVFAFFHFYQSKQKQKRIVVNETDHYFGMLDASLRVPPLNQ